MASTLFEAASSGNLDQLRFQLDSMAADINSKDESGTSALMHAIKGSHAEIVQELVARGADRTEAKEFEFPKNDEHLASIVSDENAAASQRPAQTEIAMYGSAGEMHAVPVQLDAHGGHRLPDGTVSYVHSAGFQQQQNSYQQHSGAYPPPQAYNYDAQQSHGPAGAPNGPSHEENTEEGQDGQQAKEANLPPPEVARLIPCRFFPNCRYGDKCIFAHPVAVPLAGPEGATSPLPSNANANAGSPSSANNNPAAPVFYQPPPGYVYGQAPPYGPPQHFYMGPPMPIQYSHAGVPLPLHFPPPPHSHGHPDQAASGAAFSPQAQHAQFATSPSHHFQPHLPQHVMHPQQFYPQQSGPNGEVTEQNLPNHLSNQNQSRGEKSGETAKEDGGERSGEANVDGNKNENSAPSSSNGGRGSHRRQSFNSFLHHHAIPFQPTSNLGMGSIAGASMEGRNSTGYRGKRGRGGASGFNGTYSSRPFRSNERPPCTFFLKGACNYGEECAFPHYLPDGTDARTPAAIAGETAPHKKNPFYANGNNPNHPNGLNGSTRGTRGGRGRGSHNHTTSLVHPLPSGPASSSLPTSSAFPNASTTSVIAQEKKEETASTSAAEASPSKATPVEPSSSSSTTAISSEIPKQVQADEKASTASTAPKSTMPTAQQSASIPAKPVLATNSLSNKENQDKKENKENSTITTASSNPTSKQSNNSSTTSEKKVNNVNGNNSKSSAASSATASGVPAKPRTNGSGRGHNNHHSNQNSATRKVAAPSQRVPNGDDFPALGGGLGGNNNHHSTSNGGATSSSTSNSSDSTAVNPTPQPPKINFSAVLSAPAPVKEIAPIQNDEKVAEDEKKEKEKKEKKEKANKQHQANGHATNNHHHHSHHHHLNATSPPASSKKAAPLVDEDGFSIVGAKHGSKNQNSNSSAAAGQQNGTSFAGIAPSSTVAA